jgi:prepilin-type processing-associated H-X9-DG protein
MAAFGRSVVELRRHGNDGNVLFPDQQLSKLNGSFIPSVQFVRADCQRLLLAEAVSKLDRQTTDH